MGPRPSRAVALEATKLLPGMAPLERPAELEKQGCGAQRDAEPGHVQVWKMNMIRFDPFRCFSWIFDYRNIETKPPAGRQLAHLKPLKLL